MAVTLIASALVVSLAGCAGKGASGDAGSTDQAGGDGPITLDFWHGLTGPDGPAVQKVVDAFNASQKEIVVKTNVMPWDVLNQKLLTSLSSSSGPALVANSALNLPQYAAKGAFKSLDDFYASTEYMDTSALAPAAVNASKFQGVNYGVPLNIAPMMLYYNKDLFKAAGLDPDKPPTTWDEFEQMAAKLTIDENGDGKPEQYAIALADHETIPMYQPFLWNNGGDIVSEDGKKSTLSDPAAIEALTYWINLVKDKKVSPIGLGGADADKLFQTQKAAMEIVGPWMTTGFDEAGLNYGLARPFAGPKDELTHADVVTMSVNAKADAATVKAAYTFMAYWNSVDSQITWADGSGFPPTRTDIPADKITNKYSAIFGDADVLNNSKVNLAGIPNAATITDTIFYPALQKVLNGQGSVEEVFGQASKDVQAQLDKG